MKEAQVRFEGYVQRRFGKSTTLKHYRSDLNIFRAYMGDRQPETIQAKDIDGFIEQQQGEGLKAVTINRRLSTLHSFFEYLASEKPALRWPNPVVWRRHQVKMGSTLPRDVSDTVVRLLFEAISAEEDDLSQRDQAIFGLMIDAGLRVGEVVALQVSDLAAPAEADHLAKLRVLGKGNKERIVWLTETLWDYLQSWLAVRDEVGSEALFLNQWGRAITVSGVQYRLKQYATMAEVTLSCHQLRHTFARRLAESGMPIDSLGTIPFK